jgi:hypothetical protein
VIDHTTAAGERGEARGSGHVITLRLTDTQTEAVKPIVQCAVEKAELVIFRSSGRSGGILGLLVAREMVLAVNDLCRSSVLELEA